MRIYRYHTKVEGQTLYSRRDDKEHPEWQGEYPSEIPLTKRNLIDFILFAQEEPLYTMSGLRGRRIKELEEIASSMSLSES